MKYLDFWDDIAQQILEDISQEQVFYYLFNSYPDIRKRYYSPFREDSHPDCFFFYHIDGKLLFSDKAKAIVMNCFEAIAYKYKLETLREVKQVVNVLKTKTIKDTFIKPIKVKTILETQSVEPSEKDLKFWGQYDITLSQLKTDNVKKVNKAMTIKGIKKILYHLEDQFSYRIYYNEKTKTKKVYCPDSPLRFISNTDNDDVILNFNKNVKTLIITKSYKDYRVLRNQGVNCIWIQSEVAFPSEKLLSQITSFFDEIVVLFDNDETGIKQSKKLSSKIDMFYPGKARPLWLPPELLSYGISDSSDIYKERGKEELNNFLKHSNIETYRNIS